MEKVHPWCGQPSDRGRLKIKETLKDFKARADDSDVCSVDSYITVVVIRDRIACGSLSYSIMVISNHHSFPVKKVARTQLPPDRGWLKYRTEEN